MAYIYMYMYIYIYITSMGVSKNGGTPESSILMLDIPL